MIPIKGNCILIVCNININNMEKSDYVTIILAVVSLICLIVIIIQIFMVRSEIEKQASDVYRKAGEARDNVLQAVSESATLQVYPLIIDTVTTRHLNPSLKYFETVLPMLVPRQFNIPHVCNGKINSLQVDGYQVGLLVAHSNQGSHQLTSDVLVGRVQYVYLQRKPFLVAPVEDDVIQKLKTFTDTSAFQMLDQRHVFALYAINSPQNIVTTPSTSCTLAVTSPFTQGPPLAMSGRNGIELLQELSLVRDQEPLHALGYTLG